MSLESFFGLEDADSQGSAESAEAFQERMRKNARAIKAMGGHQKRQQKKEAKLAQLLIQFLQNPQKADDVFLVVRMLQENIPGAFILAILSLADPQLENELRTELQKESNSENQQNEQKQIESPQHQLMPSSDAAIPEEIRKKLNSWGELILQAGLMMPGRTLNTVLTPEQKLKSIVLDLLLDVLRAFLKQHAFEVTPEKTQQIALLSIQYVLLHLKEENLKRSDVEIIETPL